MKVTWLLPVKNGMPYLPATLASIEAQTYRDWEIIAWDNGSTDASLDELRRWIPARLPGQVIADRPLEFGASLAAMVELASTEWCARIDADDINLPERLAQQIAFLGEHPSIALVGANVEFIDEQGAALAGARKQKLRDAEIRWLLRWHNPFNHSTVMFRRAAVLAVGNYTDCMPTTAPAVLEDYDLWLRLAQSCEMANMPQVLVRYRQHAAGVMAAWRDKQDTVDGLLAMRHSDILFYGTKGEAALLLREKFMPRSVASVSFKDLRQLRRAAIATALALGKPAAYFLATGVYRRQQLIFIYKWLKQHPLGQAVMRPVTRFHARPTQKDDH